MRLRHRADHPGEKTDTVVVAHLELLRSPIGIGASYTPPPGQAAGPSKHFVLTLQGMSKSLPANATLAVWRVDDNHGNVLKAYDAMGRPPG